MELISDQTKDFAYYYSEWIWPSASSDWMKSLLLFFDGIALALPPAIAIEVVDSDPVLAQPLMERGLLVNFAPSSWLDRQSAEFLAQTLFEFMRTRRHEWYFGSPYRTLTPEHWGAKVAPEAADAFLEEMRRQGLVSDVDEQGLVQMHPNVRLLILTAFVKVLESCVNQSSEVKLQPATDNRKLLGEYWHTLVDYLPNQAQSKHSRLFRGVSTVMARDLTTVGVDLSSVPLDEVLDFRRQQGQHYRAYARSLRGFLVNTDIQDDSEYEEALAERQEEVRDMAADLRSRSRKAFGRSGVMMGLSLIGASWTALHGDPIAAVLAGVSAAAGFQGQDVPVSSYSYLFMIRTLPGAST